MANTQAGGALRRREEIRRLVRGRAIRSQEELQALLRQRGFAAAQPTLSRDLKDLGLARTPTGYVAPAEAVRFVPATRRATALDRVLAQAALSVRAAGSLVIVRTSPAGAHPVARAVDDAALPGVAGTIAGDDTVFVAAADAGAARRLERRLRAPLAADHTRRARA